MEHDHDDFAVWAPEPRSPRAMLVIAVMVVGFWTAVGVGVALALN